MQLINAQSTHNKTGGTIKQMLSNIVIIPK